MTVAERLRHAIEKGTGPGAGSIRKFHKWISEENVPGTSYPVIHRYLKGTAKPPVEFLEVAADLLGVRLAWLVLGEGKPTELEQWVAEHGEPEAPKPRERNALDALREALGPYAGSLGSAATQEALDVAMRLTLFEKYAAGEALDIIDAAEKVGRYLRAAVEYAPANAFAYPTKLNPDSVHDFFALACQAYKRLIPVPAEARFIGMARVTGLPVS
ncbi:hypothetical protein BH24GEM2_BH24GEM2_13810 [soil metagenome]